VSDDTSVSFRTFGTPGAERLVMLVGTPIAVSLDPLPTETAARDICVLALAVEGAAIEDPGTFGSETPAEQTASSLVDLIRASLETLRPRLDAGTPLTVGLVAYREAADVALHAAAVLGETVDRLAMVAVAAPETPLDRDDLGALIERVTAKTLILNGQHDEPAAYAAATWYKDHLASARVEMVPGDGELGLPAVWARVLAHVAPHTKR